MVSVDHALCFPVFTQSANGAGGQGERCNSHPECSAHKEESLLQVKCKLNLLSVRSLIAASQDGDENRARTLW